MARQHPQRRVGQGPWLGLLVALLLPLSGCTGLLYGMRGDDPGRLLIEALTQDAAVDLCEPRSGRSLQGRMSSDSLDLFLYGMPRVPPERWRRCAGLLLEGLPPQQGALLIAHILTAYRDLLRDPALERESALQQRLTALHQTLLERPTRIAVEAAAEQLAPLRAALQAGRLGPVARATALDLLATVDDLERGRWQGRTLDSAGLSGLWQRGDEQLLRRCARRLPDPALREEARRRLVHLHLQAAWQEGGHAELLGAGWEPERVGRLTQAVLSRGHLTLDDALLARAPQRPARGRRREPCSEGRSAALEDPSCPALVQGFEVPSGALPRPTALVFTQEVRARRARVAFQLEGREARELRLRGAVRARVAGLSQALPLCPPERQEDLDLEVAPCLPPQRLRSDTPLYQLDQDGYLVLAEEVTPDLLWQVAAQEELELRLSAVGQAASPVLLRLPLRFLPPAEAERALVFGGSGAAGQAGPLLRVEAEGRIHDRLALRLDVEGEGRFVVVAAGQDPLLLRVLTRGSPGQRGADGRAGADGARGRLGHDAVCPESAEGRPTQAEEGQPGQPGEDGQPGQPGGPGGDGGEVRVRLRCEPAHCAVLRDLVERIVASEGAPGGAGGKGGAGGDGGDGGDGGSGTSCSYKSSRGGAVQSVAFDLKDAADGAEGPAGQPGADGTPGHDGASRPLVFEEG